MIGAVVSAKKASYVDCRDHLAIDEVHDIYEMILVDNENERRAYEHAEKQGRASGGRTS